MFQSQRAAVTVIPLVGVLIGVLEFFTHSIVARFPGATTLDAIVDGIVIAVFTMGILGVVLAAGRSMRNRVAEEVYVIAELNHHVRNALQVIRDSHLLPTEQQTDAVIASVDRIDRTLRHLFPGTKRRP